MKQFRVKFNKENRLYYIQKKTWYGKWLDVTDKHVKKITDANLSNAYTKGDRYVFEYHVKANWRNHEGNI